MFHPDDPVSSFQYLVYFVSLFSPIFRWGNWGTDLLSHLFWDQLVVSWERRVKTPGSQSYSLQQFKGERMCYRILGWEQETWQHLSCRRKNGWELHLERGVRRPCRDRTSWVGRSIRQPRAGFSRAGTECLHSSFNNSVRNIYYIVSGIIQVLRIWKWINRQNFVLANLTF